MCDKSGMSREVFVICPGNIAPNCPGQVGDVLIVSAVLARLMTDGWDVHCVTNAIMHRRLADTYGMSTSVLERSPDVLMLSAHDIARAAEAEHVLLFRPFGDPEGNNWQSQLLSQPGSQPARLCRIGGLSGFSQAGPHMVEQIRSRLAPVVPLPRDVPLVPLLRVDGGYAGEQDGHDEPQVMILPFAGGRQKWLPMPIILALVEALEGTAEIAATPYGEEPAALDQIADALQQRSLSASFFVGEAEDIAFRAAQRQRLYAVDGGTCWTTAAGLNWLTQRGLLLREQFPEIRVILGRDSASNLAPTAAVWKPLALVPERVTQVNSDQVLRLHDITVHDIIV